MTTGAFAHRGVAEPEAGDPGLHQEDLTGRGNTEEEPAPIELADREQGFAERRAPAGESAFLSLQVRRVEFERLPG